MLAPSSSVSPRSGIGAIAVPAMAAMALGAWLDGPALWLTAGLLVVAVTLGSVACMVGLDPRGVPVGSALLPAVAAVGGLGATHLAGLTPVALVPVGVGGAFLAMAIAAERAFVRSAPAAEESDRLSAAASAEEPGPGPAAAPTEDAVPLDAASPAASPAGGPRVRSFAEWRVLGMAVPVTFLGAVGAIGLADRGFVLGLPGSGDPLLAGSSDLVLIVVAAAAIAAAVGFRIAATDVFEATEILWMAAGYGLLAAVAVVMLRAGSVPLVSWPGILTAVVYLWGAYHRLLDPVDTTSRRVLDLLIVVGAVVLAAAAHLRPM